MILLTTTTTSTTTTTTTRNIVFVVTNTARPIEYNRPTEIDKIVQMFKTCKKKRLYQGGGQGCIFPAKKYPKRSSYDQQKTILKSVFIVTNIARPIWPMHQPTKDLWATLQLQLQSVQKPHIGLMGHPIEHLGTTQETYGPP